MRRAREGSISHVKASVTGMKKSMRGRIKPRLGSISKTVWWGLRGK